MKLKDLTEDSYFAVHYSFLKQLVLPPIKRASDDADPEVDAGRKQQIRPPGNFNTSFLVYYQISPILERAFIVGMLPLRIDDDNSAFWLSYQEQDNSVFASAPQQKYQFKK